MVALKLIPLLKIPKKQMPLTQPIPQITRKTIALKKAVEQQKKLKMVQMNIQAIQPLLKKILIDFLTLHRVV